MGTTSSPCFHCLASWEQELSVHLQVACRCAPMRGPRSLPSSPQHSPWPILLLTWSAPSSLAESDTLVGVWG